MKRVVITGLGAITPLGNNVAGFWENIINGKSGSAMITRFDTTHFKTKFACEIKNYIAEDHFERKEIRKLDPFCQYALIAADEAILDSGVDLEKIDRTRCGVIWGSGYGGVLSMQEQAFDYAIHGKIPRYTPFFIPKMIINMGAGLLSIKYGFRGINFAPAAACATSNVSLIESFNNIRWGKADLILAGGSEAAITETGVGGFNGLMALSTDNEHYSTACRPFDKTRDGFVMGEGAGAIIIEELGHALRRGAKIYAEIVGGAMTADAHHITASQPAGEDSQRAMRLALEEAGISSDEVDYINAHATSTSLGDISETKAINDTFGSHVKDLRISSTKSMTGHLLGAAGAVEAIVCIKSINHGIIPATINTENIDDEIPKGINFTLKKSEKKVVNVAMNNTFGFGGHNVISVFRKYI